MLNFLLSLHLYSRSAHGSQRFGGSLLVDPARLVRRSTGPPEPRCLALAHTRWRMAYYLIAGASGYVGSRLAERLHFMNRAISALG